MGHETQTQLKKPFFSKLLHLIQCDYSNSMKEFKNIYRNEMCQCFIYDYFTNYK